MYETGSAGQPVLFGIGGPAKGRKILLGHEVVTVGRRGEMAVTLADPKLSGHHADFLYRDGAHVLRDRMSTNGTYVNGELVAELQLAQDDRIRMGRSEFVYTTLERLDAAEAMLALRDTAELVNDSATSVIGTPKVQVSLAAQSVQVNKVCGTEELATAHKLCSLYEVARRINVLSELDALLDLVVGAILEEMGADRAVLLLPDEASGRLEPVVAKCRDGVATEGPVQVSETIVCQAVETGQSILTEDAGSDERFREGESVTLVGIRSAMCVPLLANDKVVGVAYVDKVSCTGTFVAGDLEFLTVLCNSAAISIENARLFSEVQDRNREVMEAHQRLEASYRQLEETQQKLIQAEKMSSLGRLVAGIAHDLKNILTSVTGYAQLLKAPVPDEKRATYVERLNETSAMCAQMVRDLLSFAHQDEVAPEAVLLEDLIEDALDMVQTSVEEAGIEIVRDFDSELPAVQLDAFQMMRVLTNLLTNAIQATAGTEGTRRITVRSRREAEPPRDGAEVAKGSEQAAEGGEETTVDYLGDVLIVIEDTGPGIPSDIMGKIFDPFFTTKPTGQGTGLGLSLCQGIVAAHGGQISVESAPGQGARFTLRMPIEGPLGQRNTTVETG